MSGEQNALTTGVPDLISGEKWVLYPIVLLVLFIGVYPAPILDITEPAVDQLMIILEQFKTSSR
jgi:NADH-quinone oxidoreductase subunit M